MSQLPLDMVLHMFYTRILCCTKYSGKKLLNELKKITASLCQTAMNKYHLAEVKYCSSIVSGVLDKHCSKSQ